MVKRFLIFLIKGYQKFISPLLGDNCRFYPTCSAYAIEALRVHGALKGSLLATWRILRCNPFGRPGLTRFPQRENGAMTRPLRCGPDRLRLRMVGRGNKE